MIRILSMSARTFAHCFLMVTLFFHQLQAISDQPFFGSFWKLRDNHMVKVDREFSDEIAPDEIKRIKHDIIFNSFDLLEKNQDLARRLWSSFDFMRDFDLDSNDLDKHTRLLVKGAALANNDICLENRNNAVGMLSECCQKLFNSCSLNRDDASQARERFEDKVINELDNQLSIEVSIEGGGVTLVNVGSGNLFQDLVLITRIFEKNNKQRMCLNWVFIDTKYKEYIAAVNNREEQRKPEVVYSVKNNIRKLDFHRTWYIEKYVQKTHARFVQLVRWIKQAYPQHLLNIFVYDSVDAYVVDLVRKPYLQANIYMGIDLDKNYTTADYLERAEGDTDEYKNGNEAYFSAPLDKILKPKGVGLMLTKDCFDGKKFIFSGRQIFRNHCIKILPADVQRPDAAQFINQNKPMIYGRYVVLAETYNVPWMSIHYWIWFFGNYLM